jgi:maltose O-acetyltransferase
MKTQVDEQYPWMITIGNHVRITQGVIILTHDYSWSVLKKAKFGAILGASGKVTIGDNVFVGMNAIILGGVSIGNNVIIGAGSVVTKNCDENGVYAGNPARRISDIDTFFEKRKKAQKEEAIRLARAYFDRYGKQPGEEIFHEYFMLFENKKTAQKKKWCVEKMRLGGNQVESMQYLDTVQPLFASYEDFMSYCFGRN